MSGEEPTAALLAHLTGRLAGLAPAVPGGNATGLDGLDGVLRARLVHPDGRPICGVVAPRVRTVVTTVPEEEPVRSIEHAVELAGALYAGEWVEVPFRGVWGGLAGTRDPWDEEADGEVPADLAAAPRLIVPTVEAIAAVDRWGALYELEWRAERPKYTLRYHVEISGYGWTDPGLEGGPPVPAMSRRIDDPAWRRNPDGSPSGQQAHAQWAAWGRDTHLSAPGPQPEVEGEGP